MVPLLFLAVIRGRSWCRPRWDSLSVSEHGEDVVVLPDEGRNAAVVSPEGEAILVYGVLDVPGERSGQPSAVKQASCAVDSRRALVYQLKRYKDGCIRGFVCLCLV